MALLNWLNKIGLACYDDYGCLALISMLTPDWEARVLVWEALGSVLTLDWESPVSCLLSSSACF